MILKADNGILNTFKLQYLIAQSIVNRAIAEAKAAPIDLNGPMEDWQRPNPNEPLPHWNLWGDAGLLTRPHIHTPYAKQDGQSPIHTDTQ